MTGPRRAGAPLRLLICALGGEGGGVLMNWIVAAARAAGRAVQATSVPGVAQRTGSTSYYIEIAEAAGSGAEPVLSLVPMPGRVDVVLASELVEAARAIEAGYVSPGLTTLIASTSRIYATSEKIEMGDGRYDESDVAAAAVAMARDCLLLDLDALATRHGTFISATAFGALSGSGVLPWSSDVSREVLGSARSGAASLAGFDAARDAVAAARARETESAEPVAGTIAPELPAGSAYASATAATREIVSHGFDRVVDFQDREYGQLYIERSNALLEAAPAGADEVAHALEEGCRRLALWMAYEDVARVADLKTRPERFERIRDEARMEPGQVLKVTDYLKPRPEEIAAVMPAGVGRWILRRAERGGWIPFLGKGLLVRSNGILGYRMLRLVAALRHIRRRSLRFGEEQQAIEEWLAAMRTSLARSPRFATALAELPRVLKGYSDTHVRGREAYARITQGIVRPAVDTGREEAAANSLRRAISAALAGEDHASLDQVVADAGTRPPELARC